MLSLLRDPADTATLPLLLLTSSATIATAVAYGDDSVARVALLRAVVVRVVTAFPESYRYCAYQETLLRCHCYC